MAPLSPLADRLRAANEALQGLRPAILAGAPWPMATHFGVEPEAAWGPPEVLAHVGEMLTFWLGEVERIVDGARAPVAIGRTQTDGVRLGLIERDRSLPPRELLDRISAAIGRLDRRLLELTSTEVERRGVLPSGTELTVGDLVEGYVVEHLEDHVLQLRSTLGLDAG